MEYKCSTSITSVKRAGSYHVVVIGNNGCIGTDTINITQIGKAPNYDDIWIRNIGPNTFRFSLINPTHIGGYYWDFGDGSPISFSSNPTHTYPTTGHYIVRLTVYNDCGNGADTATVHVISTTDIEELNSDY